MEKAGEEEVKKYRLNRDNGIGRAKWHNHVIRQIQLFSSTGTKLDFKISEFLFTTMI